MIPIPGKFVDHAIINMASLHFIALVISLVLYQTKADELDKSLADKICQSFGQVKCPYDPYCVPEGKWVPDYDKCLYCPSGNDIDCDGEFFDYSYSPDMANSTRRCDLKDRFKYYTISDDACNGWHDCPSGITTDEAGCNEKTCSDKTDGRRKYQCNGTNTCVYNQTQCDPCKSNFGGHQDICTESYCHNITLTKDEKWEYKYWDYQENDYKSNMTYVKCPGYPKCILAARLCDSIRDCPNGEDEKNCTKERCSTLGKFK